MQSKIVEEVRSFNRFYTGVLGLLDNYLQQSTYTLPEVRILFEVFHQDNITASALIQSMNMDKGYLSRILRKFEKNKLIIRKKQDNDNRVAFLTLTPRGKSEFEVLNTASHNQINNMLKKLTRAEQATLLSSMATIKNLLSA
jgi:DNA-binding MarR family transcriptional regulator